MDVAPYSPLPAARLGLLENPLADWPNDDLLFEQKQRDFFQRQHPRAVPLFDWPELRALFAAHDPQAALFRRRSRRFGVIAALLGCAALLVASATPISLQLDDQLPATNWLQQAMGGLAALLALSSGGIGYWAMLSGRLKWRWLAHRFWTERMRQLHFQFIVNNLELAAQAMSDAAALDRWRALRARILDRFLHRRMEPIAEALQRMQEDLAEDQPWLDEEWIEAKPTPPPSAELTELFEALGRQRFGIQRRYVGLKLKPGFHSPRTRLAALTIAADVLTVSVLILCAVTGLLFLVGTPADATPLLVLLTLSGGLSAFVLGLRVLNEGLQLQSETERYEWYFASVEALERRYRDADDQAKVAILREMERLSYQELRRFTVSFGRARFIM